YCSVSSRVLPSFPTRRSSDLGMVLPVQPNDIPIVQASQQRFSPLKDFLGRAIHRRRRFGISPKSDSRSSLPGCRRIDISSKPLGRIEPIPGNRTVGVQLAEQLLIKVPRLRLRLLDANQPISRWDWYTTASRKSGWKLVK